jgi:hypothetical protein
MPPTAVCPARSRRLPNWKADGRGVPRGSREDLDNQPYTVGVPGVPCLRSPTRVRGTRCYTEHSRARKHCQLLATNPLHQVPSGLHVWGVSPAYTGPDAVPFVCRATSFFGSNEDVDSRRDATLRIGSVALLGPYALPDGRLVVKCTMMDDLLGVPSDGGQASEGLGNALMSTDMDMHVPTVEQLEETVRQLHAAADAQGQPQLLHATSTLLLAAAAREQRERREAQSRVRTMPPVLVAKVRTMARLFLHLGFYLYRWGGPGRPYPLTDDASTLRVGSAANPISEQLQGRLVTYSLTGVRTVTRGDHPEADAVNGEFRLGNMEHAHLQCLRLIFDSCTTQQQDTLADVFRAGLGYRLADGKGFYLGEQSLIDTCFGGRGIASGRACVRINGKRIIFGILTLIHSLYRTPPAWARFEGALDPYLDPTDPSDHDHDDGGGGAFFDLNDDDSDGGGGQGPFFDLNDGDSDAEPYLMAAA